LTGTATVTDAPKAVDPFVRELDELVARAGSLPRGAVATVRAVLEALLADELDPPERDCALRALAHLPQRS
jgi:hypothetical protein